MVYPLESQLEHLYGGKLSSFNDNKVKCPQEIEKENNYDLMDSTTNKIE